VGVGSGLYMYDVVVKSSRSLSHLLMSFVTFGFGVAFHCFVAGNRRHS